MSNELRATDADPMQALTPAGNLANTQGKTWVDRTTEISVTITTHRQIEMIYNWDERARETFKSKLSFSQVGSLEEAKNLLR